MKNNYVEINKKAYDILAAEYNERTAANEHEIKDDYWYNILNKIILRENTTVLEIGPGSGRNLKMFESLNCDVTAVELSSEMSKVARERSPNSKVINKNILECVFKPKSFDIIFLMAVIHNFPLNDAFKVLEKSYDWLKDDGYLLIGTTIHKKENSGFFVKEDYSGEVERYRYKYTEESFKKLVYDNKFKVIESFIVEEKIRKKVWYDIICIKNQSKVFLDGEK